MHEAEEEEGETDGDGQVKRRQIRDGGQEKVGGGDWRRQATAEGRVVGSERDEIGVWRSEARGGGLEGT